MLPEKYKWLDTIGELPKMVAAALQYLGIREVKGESNNPAIMDMAKGLGVANIYTNDDMSWCALFINHLIRITGKPAVDTNGDKYNLLRALFCIISFILICFSALAQNRYEYLASKTSAERVRLLLPFYHTTLIYEDSAVVFRKIDSIRQVAKSITMMTCRWKCLFYMHIIFITGSIFFPEKYCRF
jgi:hypothetical protein